MAFHTKCRHRKLNDGNVDPHSILVRLVKKIESQHSMKRKRSFYDMFIFLFVCFVVFFSNIKNL